MNKGKGQMSNFSSNKLTPSLPFSLQIRENYFTQMVGPKRNLGPTIFTLPFPLQPNTLFSSPKLNEALNLVSFTFQNDTILMDLMLWILGVDVDLNSKMSRF